jgi:histidine phosphotransfer protein HptB
MSEERKQAYRSALAEHPDIKGVLPRFVARLAGHVRRLRELQASGDTAELIRLAHQLRGAGKSFGFEGMTQRAGAVEDMMLAGKDVAEVRAAVEELIAYMERVEGYGDDPR